MVKLDHISKSFGSIQALKDVSLTINEGEIFVLLGPTGAGKTTTLKITAGLIKPDEGNVYIKDNDVTDVPSAFRNISFVFENYNLFPIYNVYKNIAFALKSKLLRVDDAEIERRIKLVSKDLHIEQLLDRPTSTLSGGETQRIALARALVRQAGLNLFDEPLSNLDLKLREELRVEFKELHKQYESTIFYVTHDHDSAVSIADRIGILHEGVLHQIDTPENLIKNPVHINVASLINYPAINVLDCRLVGKKLNADGLLLYELTDAELHAIEKVTDKKDFQIGLKPRDIKMGKGKNQLSFSGKVLNIEYQGYNKVINVDLFGSNIRMITNEIVHKEYGDEINISFSKNDVLLFGRDNGKRIK